MTARLGLKERNEHVTIKRTICRNGDDSPVGIESERVQHLFHLSNYTVEMEMTARLGLKAICSILGVPTSSESKWR